MKDAESAQKAHVLEQNIHATTTQKQQFQAQLFEVEGAIRELDTAKSAFKIIGGIMVATEKETLLKELEGKKEVLELRVQTLEKQEAQFKDKLKKIQEQ